MHLLPVGAGDEYPRPRRSRAVREFDRKGGERLFQTHLKLKFRFSGCEESESVLVSGLFRRRCKFWQQRRLHHRFEFARRPRQQIDASCASAVNGFDPVAGGGTVRIRQKDRSLRRASLAQNRFRNPAAVAKSPELCDLLHQFRMRCKFEAEKAGGRVKRDVVPGGAEPSGHDQRIGAVERLREGGIKIPLVIPGREREADRKTDRAEFPAEKREIGIEGGSLEKFSSCGDDGDAHR